jgi:hypothetical protein
MVRPERDYYTRWIVGYYDDPRADPRSEFQEWNVAELEQALFLPWRLYRGYAIIFFVLQTEPYLLSPTCNTTVSVSLPGNNRIGGFWPGVWTMGNLGRAGYGATTEGVSQILYWLRMSGMPC